MAGHNKWSKVKRWKGALDAKRGKIFSKLAREVAMTAREGGADPDMNPRLRMALLKCKQANMPAENVERAIKKGTGGDDSTHYEELQYEIYGPHGIAMLVDLTTDNRNRTAAELRSLVSKRAGTIATPGAVSRLFQRKGQIIVSREAANEDDLMAVALDAGAEDFKTDPEGYEILTEPGQFEEVYRMLESHGIRCDAAQVTSLPIHTVPLENAEAAAEVNRLIEALEDHDDVREVYTNAELPAETG